MNELGALIVAGFASMLICATLGVVVDVRAVLHLVDHKNEAAVVGRLSPYRSKVGDKTMRRNVDLRGERYAELWIAKATR